MRDADHTRQPGDLILDRYMPDAKLEEREQARDNLYSFAAVILRICTRIARERGERIRPPKGGRLQ